MKLADTSKILFEGMDAALEQWAARHNGEREPLYWLLSWKLADISSADSVQVAAKLPADLAGEVRRRRDQIDHYFDDVRYVALEPVVQLWGTIVNSVRVAAKSDRATEGQKKVFDFPAESLVAFFLAAREKMEVADALYHAFRSMPAPECQALAALLNVHVDAPLEPDIMCRLVRLLDHEGPMSEEETRDLSSLANTSLVDATFRGLRWHA